MAKGEKKKRVTVGETPEEQMILELLENEAVHLGCGESSREVVDRLLEFVYDYI